MPSPEPEWGRLPRYLVPFGWRSFFRKYRLLFADEGDGFAVAKQMAGRIALYKASQFAWLIDRVVARGWERASMEGPVFIIGHQRSGTTLLHRLLAQDQPHARALNFHEMLIPAESWRMTLDAIQRWDRRHGERLSTWFQRRQDALFGPMDHIHRIRFDEIEEDEFVFWAIFASAMCVNDAPASVARRELDDLRLFDRWPPERQARILGYYRACLLKKIHREPAQEGEPVWVVAKNPAFSQKIPQLLKVFPKAKFVHLVRNPLETIPSRLSLIRAIWRRRFSEDIEMSDEQVATIVEDSIRTYTAAHRDLPQLPKGSHVTVPYTELIGDIEGAVHRIYAELNLPGPGKALIDALKQRKSTERSETSRHGYSLEEFGLDENELRERLGDAASDF